MTNEEAAAALPDEPDAGPPTSQSDASIDRTGRRLFWVVALVVIISLSTEGTSLAILSKVSSAQTNHNGTLTAINAGTSLQLKNDTDYGYVLLVADHGLEVLEYYSVQQCQLTPGCKVLPKDSPLLKLPAPPKSKPKKAAKG